MLGWKGALYLFVAYAIFEGLGKIKENDPQVCQRPAKYLLLAKAIIIYGTVSKWHKFSSCKHAGFLNIWNPVQPTNPPQI